MDDRFNLGDRATTMTLTNNSSSRIRSGDGWVRVREIPPLTPTLSAESTAVKCGVADDNAEPSSENVNGSNKKKRINRRPTPRYQDTEDRRQDELETPSSRVERVDRTGAPDGEIGFEVEMSAEGSGSLVDDNGSIGKSISDKSSLDFPLGRVSRSSSASAFEDIKAAYDNFRSTRPAVTPSSGKARSNSVERSTEINNDHTASAAATAASATVLQSSETAQETRRRRELFVDVNAEPATRCGTKRDAKDETPKTNNRSESGRGPMFSSSPAHKLSLKHRPKEGVARTLATVVQEVDSPAKRSDLDTSASPLSTSLKEDDDSSARVDTRWEMMQTKYAQCTEETGNELSERMLRDTLLDVNSATSPRSPGSSNSTAFQDELIQDCIETGLPPLEKRQLEKCQQESQEGIPNFSAGSSKTSSETPTHGNISPKIASPTTSMQNPLHDPKMTAGPQKKSGDVSSDVQLDTLEHARMETVSSSLTGDDESGGSSSSQLQATRSSSTSGIDLEESKKAVAALFEMDESDADSDQILRARSNPERALPGELLPSSSESNGHEIREDDQHARRQLRLPKRSLVPHEEDHDFQTPKIEIALAPTASSEEESISEISESSCVRQKENSDIMYPENDNVGGSKSCLLRPQHEGAEESSDSRCPMEWWRKNGRRLVKETLDMVATPRTAGNTAESSNNLVSVNNDMAETNDPNIDGREICLDESLFQESSSSVSDESTKKEEIALSAFKRGLSVFEKRNKKEEVPNPVVPKKKWQLQAAKKSLSQKNMDHDAPETGEPTENDHLYPISSRSKSLDRAGSISPKYDDDDNVPNKVLLGQHETEDLERRPTAKSPHQSPSRGRNVPRNKVSKEHGSEQIETSATHSIHLVESSSPKCIDYGAQTADGSNDYGAEHPEASTRKCKGSALPKYAMDCKKQEKVQRNNAGPTSPTKKSIQAPQPNPDADSSNSIDQGRRSKITGRPDPIDNSSSSSTARTRNRKLTRPCHEDDTVDGALEVVRTPKALDDNVPVPVKYQEVDHHNHTSPTDTSLNNAEKHAASRDVSQQIISESKTDSSERHETAKVDLRQPDDDEHAADIIGVASELTTETYTDQQQQDRSSVNVHSMPSVNKPEYLKLETLRKQDTPKSFADCHRSRSFENKVAPCAGVPSWRLGPGESLSDFSIQIYCKKSDTSELYHVHKHILGVGARRSGYLRRLFLSSATAMAKIALVDEAASFVPELFDYVYCHDFNLPLSTDNVLAFRYLADVFQIRLILKQTAEFILNDLEIANMSEYILESSRYQDEVVTKMIAARCGEEITSIDITDLLWTAMDPKLFLRVLSCPKIDRKETSRHLSLLLVEYHGLHKYEVDAHMFQDLSSVSLLPLIHRNAAIPLLEICDEYGAPLSLQPLQKRCAQEMAFHWKTTSEPDRRRLFALLRSLPSSFTVDFLETVETGKATSITDSTIPKVSRETKPMIDDYEDAGSFTPQKLCRSKICQYTMQAEQESPLSWRMDPSQSFSDWTVKVKHRQNGKIDVYNVHKHMLSIGQFKSTFFAETFLTEDHANSRKGSTIIELAEGPAELVPVVLDFIYAPDHDLVITTRTASALRFLSRVFGIWMLNKRVVEYVQRDMDLTNMLSYLEQADLFDDERITNIAIRKCATKVKSIDPESDLLRGIKPDFFGRVVASTEIDKSASCHINILIAKYFTLHDLDERLLGELMKHVPMKEIDQDSAMQLLSVMSSVKSQGTDIFADIRRRCADIMVENWKEIRQENRQEAFEILRNLHSSLLADIFDAVEQDYNNEHYETMTVQSKLVKRYRSQLAEAKTQRDKDIAKVREESEMLMSELLQKQQDLEAQLAQYQDATSRRALRSSGGYSHTRVASPRQSSFDSSRQSFIPRLNSRGTRMPSPLSTANKPPPQGQRTPRDAGPSYRQLTQATGTSQSQCSLFGRVFACSPGQTSPKQRMDVMGHALPPAPQFQHNIGHSAR